MMHEQKLFTSYFAEIFCFNRNSNAYLDLIWQLQEKIRMLLAANGDAIFLYEIAELHIVYKVKP